MLLQPLLIISTFPNLRTDNKPFRTANTLKPVLWFHTLRLSVHFPNARNAPAPTGTWAMPTSPGYLILSTLSRADQVLP